MFRNKAGETWSDIELALGHNKSQFLVEKIYFTSVVTTIASDSIINLNGQNSKIYKLLNNEIHVPDANEMKLETIVSTDMHWIHSGDGSQYYVSLALMYLIFNIFVAKRNYDFYG